MNSEFDVQKTSLAFLNPSQGIGPDISLTGKNGPSIFPTTSLSLRIKYQQESGYYAQAAIFDGVPGDPNNPSGNHIILRKEDGALLAAETGFINMDNGISNNYGKYAIGCWYYTSEFKLHNTNGITEMHEGNFGFYVYAEKQVYHEVVDQTRGLSVFVRAGHAENNINKISEYLGMGFLYKGLFNSRDRDALGIALAIVYTSNWYQQELNVNEFGIRRKEIDYELTYKMYLLEWLNFQPDVQYLYEPLYNVNNKYVFVMGIRLSLQL